MFGLSNKINNNRIVIPKENNRQEIIRPTNVAVLTGPIGSVGSIAWLEKSIKRKA